MKSDLQQTRGWEIPDIKSLDEIPGLVEYLDALDAIEARRAAIRRSPHCCCCEKGDAHRTPPGRTSR